MAALSEQEEFELLSLERERAMTATPSGAGLSTFGGVAGEFGKGLVRGVSDIGLGAAKGALALRLGPIAAEFAGRGIEQLAAPSRALVAPAPEGPAEEFAGTAGEFAGAFAAPGAPGLAQRGVQLASRALEPVVAPVGRIVRNLVDPLLPGGIERAVGRTLLKLSGEKRARVMSALADTEPAAVALRINGRIYEAQTGEVSHGQIVNRLVKESPEVIAPAGQTGIRTIEEGWARNGRFLDREQALRELGFNDTQRALAGELVPGSFPTAAEAATKAGSAEFAGAQRLAEQRLPTGYQDIATAQESARQAAIQSFGKTPQQLEKAITDRARQAKKLYEEAAKQVLRVDDELKALLETDSMKKAAGRVIAENNPDRG